jgi:hypothetical protein
MMKYLCILFIGMLMFSLGVSAQPELDVSHDYAGNTVTVDISNVNESYASYTLFGFIGKEYEASNYTILGEVFYEHGITSDGQYTYTMDMSCMPHDLMLDREVYLVPRYENGSFATEGWGTFNDTVFVGVSPLTTRYRFMIRDVDYSSIRDNGFSVNMATYQYNADLDRCEPWSPTAYVFIARLQDGAPYRFAVTRDGISPTMQFRSLLYLGIPGYEEVRFGAGGTSFTTRASHYALNETYYHYVGVHTTETVETDVIDDEMNRLRFSVNNILAVGGLSYDHSRTHNFWGAYHIYDSIFSPTESVGMGELEMGSFGEWTVSYGEQIGVPFFSMIVMFTIVLLFTMVPFGFATRYGFSLPNFMYLVFIGMGVFICYSLGLLLMRWVILYMLIMFVALISRYKEFIQKAVMDIYTVAEKEQSRAEKREFRKAQLLPKPMEVGYIKGQERHGNLITDWEGVPEKWLTTQTKLARLGTRSFPKAIRRDPAYVRGHKDYAKSYMKQMKKKGYGIKGRYWVPKRNAKKVK